MNLDSLMKMKKNLKDIEVLIKKYKFKEILNLLEG